MSDYIFDTLKSVSSEQKSTVEHALGRIIVVVPCFNEEERLDCGRFVGFRKSHNVSFLFVNDGSHDKTRGILEDMRSSDPLAFYVLHLEKNSGKAEAVRLGMQRAFEFEPEFAGYWDADLATPLEAVLDFVDIFTSRPYLQIVIGARVQLLGREISRSPKRHYLGRIFATAASVTLGLPVYDTQCGAKLFRVSPTTMALFKDEFLSSWVFDVEVLARLVRERRLQEQPSAAEVIFEFPLHRWTDVGGSKLKAIDYLKAPFELLTIYNTYLRERRQKKWPTSSSLRV